MSQRSVERTLGKLISDEMFRRAFFADPTRATRAAGLDLLPDELQALLRAPRKMPMALEGKLEDLPAGGPRVPIAPGGSR